MKAVVAVVEDDPNIARLIATYLEGEGYRADVYADGETAWRGLSGSLPDLVVLDLMLPGIDGLELCRRIRATSDVPVVMVTARDAEIDRILGLELGADDYVTKPFSPRELVARVKAVLRRTEISRGRGEGVLRLGGVSVDPSSREVHVGDREVRLTAREFDLLEYLVRNRGLVLTREQILQAVWGYADHVDPRTVDVHVRQIRRKLGEASPVETVWGVGYKTVPPPAAPSTASRSVSAPPGPPGGSAPGTGP